ncbi:hypothetical protein BQ8482_90007 [Mesorhizobium delmotii]|uniref:Uncharacterized protein n=1 Tax=Mesorhizobium delmotii TaxID=1631247 RepID=A0A2P9AWS8_9HYPH|nr:hypothetical protein BQ8482_90007 [Mesorhizobium delmotii]
MRVCASRDRNGRVPHALLVDERGLPVEWIGKAPDIETAVYAAECMGPGYVAGTWAYCVA